MWDKEGWKVEPIVKATAIGIAPDGTNEVSVRTQATANSKFAPAKAISTAYAENGGGGDVWANAEARATGKPAAVFGVTMTASDATAISGGDVLTAAPAAVLSSSRATGGMGVGIAKAYGRSESAEGAFTGIDMRSKVAKWCGAPARQSAARAGADRPPPASPARLPATGRPLARKNPRKPRPRRSSRPRARAAAPSPPPAPSPTSAPSPPPAPPPSPPPAPPGTRPLALLPKFRAPLTVIERRPRLGACMPVRATPKAPELTSPAPSPPAAS